MKTFFAIPLNNMRTFINTKTVKRCLAICLLLPLATAVFGCAIPGTHNYYLFSVIDTEDWQSDINQRTLDNWRAYTKNNDLHWFDADAIRSVAHQRGDGLMVSYLDHLVAYLTILDEARPSWDYPTKMDLEQHQEALKEIQAYALSKTSSNLRSQHALLYMRCCMMLELHQENIRFWEGTASKYINSVYRDMMRNIYAGALLKTGRNDEATQIYAEQGDLSSLYTYYYKKRSFEAIRDEYQARPDSPAFPFLLQDFANNAQEAYDEQQGDNWPGKLFIRDVKEKECQQMCDLAARVVKEGKTSNPVLWQSLQAWLQYLMGNRDEALAIISGTQGQEGTARAKDNARVLRLFIQSSVKPVTRSYNDFLAEELSWLEQQAKTEGGEQDFYYNHYTQVYDRLVHQVLFPKFQDIHHEEWAIAFLQICDQNECFAHIDTTAITHVVKYRNFLHRSPVSALDRWLQSHIKADDTFFHELLGTKYLRLARWREAIAHLEKVPLSYIREMNIAPYMACRNYRIEPWLQRQRYSEEMQEHYPVQALRNQKLQFAREMLSLEQGLGRLPLRHRALRSYLLAVRYAQASFAGDAWYITRYSKSCYDAPRADEVNMLMRASRLLNTALKTGSFADKEKVLFAKAWLPVDSWYKEKWNDQQFRYDQIALPNSHQYKALDALVRFERQHSGRTSAYVSRCDVLRQFMEQQ